jgi:predicted RNase H-like nuclease (RuvC/YqgF family)
MLPVGGNIVELQQKIIDLENHLAQNRHHNEELSMKLEAMNEEQDKVRMLEQRVSELKFDNAELQSQVEEKSAAVSAVEVSKIWIV